MLSHLMKLTHKPGNIFIKNVTIEWKILLIKQVNFTKINLIRMNFQKLVIQKSIISKLMKLVPFIK